MSVVRRLGSPIDAACCVFLFTVAVGVRWEGVAHTALTSDSIGPYLKAWSILEGAGLLPTPHAPESGPALYWLSTPILAASETLREVFAGRALVQALLAPLLYVVVRVGAGAAVPTTAACLGGLGAGLLAASSWGLLETLSSGYQTFLAPELLGCLTLGLVTSFQKRSGGLLLATAALPLAMMVHAFSIAWLPGLVLALALAWRQGRRREVACAALVGGLLSLPRLWQLAEVANRSNEGLGALESIARMHGAPDDLAALLAESLRGATAEPAAAVLMCAPLVLLTLTGRRGPSTTAATLAGATLLAAASLLAAGSALGYLRPYHWRLLLPAQAACTGLALALFVTRLGRGSSAARKAAVLGALAGIVALSLPPLSRALQSSPPSDDLALHQTLADQIVVDAAGRSRWMESARSSRQPWGSPAALFLAQRLAGAPAEALEAPEWLYLVVSGQREDLAPLQEAFGWSLPLPEDLQALSTPAPGAGVPGSWLVAAGTRSLWGGEGWLLLVRLEGPSSARAWTEAWCEAAAPSPHFIDGGAGDYLGPSWPGHGPDWERSWISPCARGD